MTKGKHLLKISELITTNQRLLESKQISFETYHMVYVQLSMEYARIMREKDEE